MKVSRRRLALRLLRKWCGLFIEVEWWLEFSDVPIIQLFHRELKGKPVVSHGYQ